MRSPTFTFLLLLFTLAVGGIASVRFSQGNLNILFGASATKQGEHLYNFDRKKVHRIRLAGNDVRAECVIENNEWKIVKPWSDRMDIRTANAIIDFTLGTQVVDAIPAKKKIDGYQSANDSAKGDQPDYVDGTIKIWIEDKDGEPLAKYRLGRPTAFKFWDEKEQTETPTVVVEPQDKNRKDYTYACTGDIHLLFKDGFRMLRDHHPLYFNPLQLENIRIRSAEGELNLKGEIIPGETRDKDNIIFRITSPAALSTDSQAIKTLLSDLFRLQAKRISNRAEVTLPPAEAGKTEIIALRHFHEADETILEIYPPSPADSDIQYATVSNRPDAVFELIRKPLASDGQTLKGDDDIVSIANLPDTVNELRNQNLTNIDGSALASIEITPSTGESIKLVRETSRSDFKLKMDGVLQPPNLESLQRLLVLITRSKVAGFPNDTATDLTPYGLDRPAITLEFTPFSGAKGFKLIFGQGRDGTWYSNRVGSPTVLKIDDSFINNIPVQPWDWRNTVLWSISAVDVKAIERTIGGQIPLTMEYSFGPQTWTAHEGPKDRSAEIDNARANHLLDAIVNLRAGRWLAPDKEDANRALLRPLLHFTLLTRVIDEQGQEAGVRTRELSIAPASNALNNRTFYGRIDGELSPFLLNEADVASLAANLFGD